MADTDFFAFPATRAALDRFAEAGRPLGVWLRDDDAVAPTAALDRLVALCALVRLPILLAVIPAGAEAALGAFVADHPSVNPCQHGFAHRNQAAAGERAIELGGERPLEAVCAELAEGRARLENLFGPRLRPVLVPPWNRIAPALEARLPGLGYSVLSTFGPPGPAVPGLKRLNCDLDIIDWRNGRVGRSPEDLDRRLAALVADRHAAEAPVGILTHHLAHDRAAWEGLELMLRCLGRHPAVRFDGLDSVI